MFVELTRGRSFAGLARYCLHDEGRRLSSRRVEFVSVRNLPTDNPHVAWRLMVAKDSQRDRLKAEAGVGRGGAKDGKPVGHLILSWKPEEAEAERLDRQKMLAAAEGALRAIGAGRREAIVVAHNDTAHPHLHVILCLVMDDGRLKKNYKEREKLSRWALERERELHGEAIVKKREENWEARERGETPAPVRKKKRHLYELEKAAKDDPALRPFAEEHLRRLAELERRKASSLGRYEAQRRRLGLLHVERSRRRQREHADRVAASRTAVRKAHRQRWRELFAEQEAGRRRFERNERTLRGRVANAFRSVDWRAMVVNNGRRGPRDPIVDAFRVAANEGERRRGLRRKQERDKAELASAQARLEAFERKRLGKRHAELARLGRRAFSRLVGSLQRRREAEVAAERVDQKRLTRERNEALRASRERVWPERTAERLKLSRVEKRRAERKPISLVKREPTDPLQLVSNREGDSPTGATAARIDEAKGVIMKKPRTRRERKPRGERKGRGGRAD